MKKLPIIFTMLALAFILAHLWLGPIYVMSDLCACGQQRTWISFDDNPRFREKKYFLKITMPGDPKHQHEFIDPQYHTNPALCYVGVGFGLASVLIWTRPPKQVSLHCRYDHVA